MKAPTGKLAFAYRTISKLEAERDQLRAEVEALRACCTLQALLPELDEALEDLELFGLHSDQGYRKLKDWYRKMMAATKAVDAALADAMKGAQP